MLNRDTVSDWEREIVFGVGFSRVCIAVSVASDNFDTKLIEPLEPLFCVG